MEEATFEEISGRLHNCALPVVEGVVGILDGGLVPSTLLAHQLKVPLAFLRINYRDEDNNPRYQRPVLLAKCDPLPSGGTLLLVDDVSVSGQTLQTAKEQLSHCRVITLVLKGKADHVIFPEIEDCVNWPWKAL